MLDSPNHGYLVNYNICEATVKLFNSLHMECLVIPWVMFVCVNLNLPALSTGKSMYEGGLHSFIGIYYHHFCAYLYYVLQENKRSFPCL